MKETITKLLKDQRKLVMEDKGDKQLKALVPILYDWIANQKLTWPSLSCRWGSQFDQGRYQNRQYLYLSEQTDGSEPNTLVVAKCKIVKPRVAPAQDISGMYEEGLFHFLDKFKTIIHPGEVNRIRELPQNNKIVGTHTDSPNACSMIFRLPRHLVLIWDVESQPNRNAVSGASESCPDLILTGHLQDAQFAMAMCSTEPFVLSGGKDKCVVLWSVQDHISSLADSASKPLSMSPPRSSSKHTSKAIRRSPTVGPRGVFKGHEGTVEEVQFCPSSSQEFCSVGDDSCLIFWDARVGMGPVMKVDKAHNADLHCVDWNSHDPNLILTGSADGSVCLFDRRNLTREGVGSPLYKFEGHKGAVLCIQWSPDKASIFGSSAEDGLLNLWDYEKVDQKKSSTGKLGNNPPGLFFRHSAHRDQIIDFHWNPSDPWIIVSISADGEKSEGGGTLQVWRVSDLLYRPEEEVLSEMQSFKEKFLSQTRSLSSS